MAEIQTGVDQLMELVRKHKKISVPRVAKALKQPEKTVQAWVDFLVEEHILGIEYKFTTPYIYVHSEDRLQAVQGGERVYTIDDFKVVFARHAQQKNIPQEKIASLWKEHLRYMADTLKPFFMQECNKYTIDNKDALFAEYMEALTSGA